MLTKGNFTRDEWNHLLYLFNISHSSSAKCSEVMSKRTKRIRRRTSHSEVAANDESYCKGAVARIILDLSEPGKEKLRK